MGDKLRNEEQKPLFQRQYHNNL